jgi:DNA-binding LacI/PurR family transcriptional regulator
VVDLGHRHVGLLVVGDADDPARADRSTQAERMRGWLDALNPAGVRTTVIATSAYAEDDGAEAVRELLAAPDRPTALLCFSDARAAAAVWAAQEIGFTVPEDLSVVGFDDSPLARRVRPMLTTVRQDAAAKGTAAAAALVDAIARRRAGADPQVTHVVLPTELVVRDSTATPPAP